MDSSRSREALAEFLTYLGNKGLMAKATVDARKAAASKVLGILDSEEAGDVTRIDLNEVIERFGRLHGKNYTPDSLATYRSRLRSALSDFSAYTNNPLAFKPSVQSRERLTKQSKDALEKAAPGKDETKVEASRTESFRTNTIPLASSSILPIPIRADLTVYVQGLPFDLTEGEARKIAGVITAMANP